MDGKQNRHIVRKTLLIILIVAVSGVIVLGATLFLSMHAPNGNKTLNRSGRVSGDVAAISDSDSNVPQGAPKHQVFTFLVAGKDKVADNTDTIMLVKLDITHKSISILNIPRDTMLKNNYKNKKINASFERGGIEQFEKDIASITGFYVNRYVMFDLEGVAKIIDAIGGVDFDVPRNMNYDDPAQNLHIHLKKGWQHLDGEQAVGLARYRHGYNNGDIGRISVQQDLIKALARQAVKPENLLKLPELISLFNENITTDIDFNELTWLANQAKDIPMSSIETNMVPGDAVMKEGLSYWLPYKNALLELINDKYNPLDEQITENDVSIPSYPENEGK
ncbi:MAG: LCP family protein [Clostridia bacterium]|nr:LCP family protein [Clostridia bacterium]